MIYNTVKIERKYNRQGDSPESLIITPPHLLAALVAIVAPLTTKAFYNLFVIAYLQRRRSESFLLKLNNSDFPE